MLPEVTLSNGSSKIIFSKKTKIRDAKARGCSRNTHATSRTEAKRSCQKWMRVESSEPA